MNTLVNFAKSIQELLALPLDIKKESNYLDLSQNTLSQNTPIDKNTLLEKIKTLPEENPLAEAVFLVIQTMEQNHLTKAKIGINEIFKAYLRNIDQENQKECTEIFTDYFFEIYLYSLQKCFPYTDLFWSYLSSCFHTVSQYLVETGCIEGCEVFLQKIAAMGKTAAQKGLHTSNIQHLLHTLELRARELGYDELANTAKNHRFNLETF